MLSNSFMDAHLSTVAPADRLTFLRGERFWQLLHKDRNVFNAYCHANRNIESNPPVIPEVALPYVKQVLDGEAAHVAHAVNERKQKFRAWRTGSMAFALGTGLMAAAAGKGAHDLGENYKQIVAHPPTMHDHKTNRERTNAFVQETSEMQRLMQGLEISAYVMAVFLLVSLTGAAWSQFNLNNNEQKALESLLALPEKTRDSLIITQCTEMGRAVEATGLRLGYMNNLNKKLTEADRGAER